MDIATAVSSMAAGMGEKVNGSQVSLLKKTMDLEKQQVMALLQTLPPPADPSGVRGNTLDRIA